MEFVLCFIFFPQWLDFVLQEALPFFLVEGSIEMEFLDDFISTIDAILDSKRKRHITGGILLSAALLFGGLAITVVTIASDEQVYDE